MGDFTICHPRHMPWLSRRKLPVIPCHCLRVALQALIVSSTALVALALVPPRSSSRASCPSPATPPVRALRCGLAACRWHTALASRWRGTCGPTLARGGCGGLWQRPFDFPILYLFYGEAYHLPGFSISWRVSFKGNDLGLRTSACDSLEICRTSEST